MTREERKAKIAYLNRAFHAEKNAKAWAAKLERDRSLAERITRTASEGGTAPSAGNATENCLIRLAATREGLQAALRDLADVREEIAEAIRGIDDLDAQTVLVRHFLNYEPFDMIAVNTHWGRTTVFRKYNRGLEMLVLNGTA